MPAQDGASKKKDPAKKWESWRLRARGCPGRRSSSDGETEDGLPITSCVTCCAVGVRVEAADRPCAGDLGIHEEALREWVRQAEADSGRRRDLLTSRRERGGLDKAEEGELRGALKRRRWGCLLPRCLPFDGQ